MNCVGAFIATIVVSRAWACARNACIVPGSILNSRYRRSSVSFFVADRITGRYLCAYGSGRRWIVSRIENVDGVVFVLYGFLVLCSSSFCFMEFVESSSAVFFKTNSRPPLLTVSGF